MRKITILDAQLKSDLKYNSEYIIMTDFKGINSYVDIKHKTCGQISNLKIYDHITRNKKCLHCFPSNKIKGQEEFIKVATFINGDKFDYSLVKYEGSSKKVNIICNLCDIKFSQTPNNHISKGHGCPNCFGNLKLKKEKVLESFNKKHGEKYDYSKFGEYQNIGQKIEILCKNCDVNFTQSIKEHLKHGCSSCSRNKKLTSLEILNRFNKIYNGKYIYDLTNFSNVKSKIKVLCDKHGWFDILVRNHLLGHSCNSCKISKGESKILEVLSKYNIKYIPQFKFSGCKNRKELPFDFYLPDYNICIEYDGIQHFKSNDHFGGDDEFITRTQNDQIKTNWCKNNNIDLIRIPYFYFERIEEIIKTFL